MSNRWFLSTPFTVFLFSFISQISTVQAEDSLSVTGISSETASPADSKAPVQPSSMPNDLTVITLSTGTLDQKKDPGDEERVLNLSEPTKDLEKNLADGDLRFIGYVIDAPVIPKSDQELMKEFGVWYIEGIRVNENLEDVSIREKIKTYAETYNERLTERLHHELDPEKYPLPEHKEKKKSQPWD